MKLQRALTFFLFSVAACTANAQSYRFEVTNTQVEDVKFKFLHAKQDADKTVLVGSLFHKFSKTGFEKGHVDIAVYDASGKFLFDERAYYGTPLNAYREWVQTGVRFTATLPTSVPEGALIKVSFHSDSEGQDALHAKPQLSMQ